MSKKAISVVAAYVKAVSPPAFSSSAKPQHGQKGKKKTEALQGFTGVPSGEPVPVISKHHSDGFAEKQMPDDPAWIALLDDLHTMPIMALRAKYAGEANTHRNMLQRVKSHGAVVHPTFRSFTDFLRLVGPKPTKQATIDRIDNNDPEYAPGKVRWADKATQNSNKGDSLIFTCLTTGRSYSASQLAAKQGVMGKREVSFVHLHVYKDRHGKSRAYYKPPGGKGIPLPLPVGSPEFLLAYAKAVEGEKLERAKAKTPTVKDTFRDLLRLYLGSALYSKLSPSSKRNYRRILEKFCEKYGHLPVSQFSRKHASGILGKLSGTPEAANTLMKRLRLLLNYAVDIGMIPSNPMSGMKGYASNEDGYHTWTEEEIAQFIARHPLGTKAYLALMLMLNTAQRKSDTVIMGWANVSDGMIRVKQQKTKKELMIPIIPALQEALAMLSKDAPTFLLTEYGRPFSVAGFGNWMRDRCDEAGLPNCSSHGLRKACSRRLAERGCTFHEIKAITGHKTDAEVRRYTDKADQVRLAHSAFEKLQDTTKNLKSANPH